MPEFCADCNHDRRDHFDDLPCTVQVFRSIGFVHRWSRKLRARWEPCHCNTYVPEEDS